MPSKSKKAGNEKLDVTVKPEDKQEVQEEAKELSQASNTDYQGDLDRVLVFRARKPLTVRAFEAAAAMLRAEAKALGLEIVLIPFSAEVSEKE